jgi:hypothetical protein
MIAEELLSTELDLLYFFEKYIKSMKKGKPNPRLVKQLITMIEAHEVYLVSKTQIQE